VVGDEELGVVLADGFRSEQDAVDEELKWGLSWRWWEGQRKQGLRRGKEERVAYVSRTWLEGREGKKEGYRERGK
jgi:hypothetical protein